MDDYFDKVYLSYELRELKPSEAIFRKVIADSGIVPAPNTLHRRRAEECGRGAGAGVRGVQARTG